mmetsp:Transcript_38246/g.118204  ORF Transcript_38246/g.118204 Transcript_38246/m.118204 type:complete len:227 (-) Transcript_38246:1264-1944(-)
MGNDLGDLLHLAALHGGGLRAEAIALVLQRRNVSTDQVLHLAHSGVDAGSEAPRAHLLEEGNVRGKILERTHVSSFDAFLDLREHFKQMLFGRLTRRRLGAVVLILAFFFRLIFLARRLALLSALACSDGGGVRRRRRCRGGTCACLFQRALEVFQRGSFLRRELHLALSHLRSEREERPGIGTVANAARSLSKHSRQAACLRRCSSFGAHRVVLHLRDTARLKPK